MGLRCGKIKEKVIMLSEAEIETLKTKTIFNKQQILDLHTGFLNDCPNGKLNKKQFVEIYKQFYPSGKSEQFCKFVFKAIDVDMSGEIDFLEFLVFISATSSGHIHDKLRMTFKIYDINRDGKIEKAELLKLVKAIYDLRGEKKRPDSLSLPVEVADKIMTKFDQNQDGYLSEEEFVNGCINDDFLRSLLAPNLNIAKTC